MLKNERSESIDLSNIGSDDLANAALPSLTLVPDTAETGLTQSTEESPKSTRIKQAEFPKEDVSYRLFQKDANLSKESLTHDQSRRLFETRDNLRLQLLETCLKHPAALQFLTSLPKSDPENSERSSKTLARLPLRFQIFARQNQIEKALLQMSRVDDQLSSTGRSTAPEGTTQALKAHAILRGISKELGQFNFTPREIMQLADFVTDSSAGKNRQSGLNSLPEFELIRTQAKSLCDSIRDIESSLVSSNLRLVLKISHRFARYKKGGSFDKNDLIQEGNLALLRAVQNFNQSTGFSFSTYAFPAIVHAVRGYLTGNSHALKATEAATVLAARIDKLMRNQTDEQAYSLNEALAAEKLGVSRDRIREVTPLRRSALSIDSEPTIDKNGSRESVGTLLDLIADDNTPPPDDLAIRRSIRELLQTELERLPESQGMVLRRVYALDGENPESLKSIAERTGKSSTQVSNLLSLAIRRLKHPSVRERLEEAL